MAHRESIKAFLNKIDIGGLKVVDWARGTKPVINYCKGKPAKYFGIDKLVHVGADLVIDICSKIELWEEGKYDVAFCMEAIEHVEYPEKMLENIFFNLKEGGKFYLSAPFQMRTHSPEDYWRFTELGLALMAKRAGFTVDEIVPSEGSEGWLMKAHK